MVYNPAVEAFSFGPEHPFRLDRGKLFMECASKHGVLDPKSVVLSRAGNRKDLLSFHDRDYIGALREADSGNIDPEMFQFGLGLNDNPIFRGIWDLSLIFAGNAVRACEVLAGGEPSVFVPLGGFHHAMRGRAGGFCYVNDIGIAIEDLLDRGMRILYLDIDAHHGDGVQDAFLRDPRVLKISFHESGKTLFPFGGFETDTGAGKGEGYNVNVPMLAHSDDEVFLWLFKRIFPPLAGSFEADVVIAEAGVDMMASDPLTHTRLTNNAYAEALRIIVQWSEKLLVFGGGGYNPDNIMKGYTLAWAALNRIGTDGYDVAMLGGSFLGSTELDSLGSLRDMSFYTSGSEKELAMAEAARVYEFIRERIFPKFGLGKGD